MTRSRDTIFTLMIMKIAPLMSALRRHPTVYTAKRIVGHLQGYFEAHA